MKRIQKKSNKCRFERKTEYYSEESANRGKVWIWGRDPQADIMDLHVYLCPKAPLDKPHWHIGHKSYYQQTLTKRHINQTIPTSEKF